MNTEEINTYLIDYFCQDEMKGKEETLINLHYPNLGNTTCDSLQAVYFILEYRVFKNICKTYEKWVLEDLIKQNNCTLEPPPDFGEGIQHFIVGVVKH